jgi:LacI family transcriptional regulator
MNRARTSDNANGVATIVDVAREADVSTATVSRVLNGTSGVSADRAERVRNAAARLGYVPCGSARALRRQQATVWAAIVPDIANPFFTALVRGIEDVARARNHRLVLCNSDEDLEREASYLDIVVAERMAGVVIAVASNRDSSLAPLIERGVPTVAVDRRPAGSRLDSVVVDNRSGAAEATAHLLAGGARRIGCITGPRRVNTSTERLDGYRDALAARGLGIDRSLIRRADFKEEGGYRATRSLFESGAAPDALFIANNPMAVGALRALRELGLTVPRDVALVAFDDSPWTTLTTPELSVVAQPAYEIGRVAAELLATSSEARPARTIVLSPTLIVRASSVRPALDVARKRA